LDYPADRFSEDSKMHTPGPRTLSANEAKTHFGELLDLAQRGPVHATRRNRVVGVMVSAADFEAMRAFYADRLLGAMHRAAKKASEKGLSPAVLYQLLADES